jgi:hypothetical protein
MKVGEVYCVDRIEELVVGQDTYRIEVLRSTQNTGAEPGAAAKEPFSVRAYKLTAIEVQPAGSPRSAPVAATVWVRFPLDGVHDHALEDHLLEEARAALVEEANHCSRGQ